VRIAELRLRDTGAADRRDHLSPGAGTTGEFAGALLRPARALLGWLADEQAYRLLASGRDDATPTPERRALVASARAAVAARAVGLDQHGVVSPAPPELAEHERALRATYPAVFAEGWAVRMVDLSRLCAFQPVVYTDLARERTAAAGDGDVRHLAALTLPTGGPPPLRASFDEKRNAWVIVSSNRNLRLVGRFTAPVPGAPVGGGTGGTPGFGFVVTIMPSHLQVVELQGRYYLRDGYHRALGLLASGIAAVPALVASFSAIEELAVPGALPQATYTGARPPILPDYLSSDVATEVQLPMSQKMVLVQGMELDFLS
jgi:hypothetical protein